MGTFSSLCASDKLNTKKLTSPIIHLSERRFVMKRLFILFLICSMVLLSAGSVSAEENLVMPYPADTEVNIQFGVYYAEIADVSTIGSGGYIDAALYEQDLYLLSDIDGLKPGSRVQIEGTEYAVASVTPKGDGSIDITAEGNSALYSFRPYGELYAVEDSSGYPAATWVGDYRIMMPLPDAFRYCSIDSDDNVKVYDADQFVEMMAGNACTFNRAYTVLSFGKGAPYRLILGTKMIPFPTGAVQAANKQITKNTAGNTGTTTGSSTGIKSGNISSVAKPGSSSVVPAGSSTGTNTGNSTAANAGSFTLHPVVWDGVGLGKCAIPAGYEMNLNVYCNDQSTCFGAPFRYRVEAVSGSAVLGYFSSEVYVERVSGYYRQNNGAHDPELDTFMMTYMNASQYCDWIASRMVSDPAFWKEEDASLLNSKVEYAKNYYKNNTVDDMASVGIKTNWYDVTAAQRVYTYQHNGETYALCILAEVRAFQMKSGVGVLTYWDIPEYFYMISSVSDFDRIHATDFQAFTSNTAFSDTFTQLQDDLSNQIRKKIEEGWARDIAYSNAYTAAMNALVTSSVESCLHSSSYSASDRFSDYIFDQNEYTTGDGYTCNISTSYDYVWDGGNGTVYYSNNALDMPAGATQLSPR